MNDAILYVRIPAELKDWLEEEARARMMPLSMLVRVMLAAAKEELETA